MVFDVKLFDPWLSRVLPEGGSEEKPLSALRSVDDHVHGELLIIVDGEALPRLGFFGPRDVCVGTWVRELVRARVAVATPQGCHTFDEGEQGQPAFRFERIDDRVEVSVVDSDLSGAAGDHDWGVRSCYVSEFQRGVTAFLAELALTLEDAAPGVGRSWTQHAAGSS
jgi:hypothetical protein